MTDIPSDDIPSPRTTSRAVLAGTIIVVIVTVLLCLIPFASADLFWQLRAGHDILSTGHAPHADSYSWINHGTRWVAPEWLSFVVFWLVYRASGFFGTWMLMVALALTTAMIVWFRLLRRVGFVFALVMANLMLLAMASFFQERPYLFTYVFLAVSLIVVIRARENMFKGLPSGGGGLLWLIPICALWTNLHQGGLALAGLLVTWAIGDGISAILRRRKNEDAGGYVRQALALAASGAGCLVAGMASPYGWGVYWNVIYTLQDRIAMSMVQEWRPVTSAPVTTVWGFYLLAAVVICGYIWTRRQRDIGEMLVVAALLAESVLHLRNVSLFAIGSAVLASPHVASAWEEWRRRLAGKPVTQTAPVNRQLLALGLGLVYVIGVARICLPQFIDQIDVNGYSREGIGEAVIGLNWFPSKAVDFMQGEGFPSHLRIFNDYNIGGFLIFRLPEEPVFVDSRADVYIGRTLNDYTALVYGSPSDNPLDIINHYDFDCVITTDGNLAQRFALTPGWQLVYGEPPPNGPRARTFVLLRTRPEYRDLIACCVRDCEIFHAPQQ